MCWRTSFTRLEIHCFLRFFLMRSLHRWDIEVQDRSVGQAGNFISRRIHLILPMEVRLKTNEGQTSFQRLVLFILLLLLGSEKDWLWIKWEISNKPQLLDIFLLPNPGVSRGPFFPPQVSSEPLGQTEPELLHMRVDGREEPVIRMRWLGPQKS